MMKRRFKVFASILLAILFAFSCGGFVLADEVFAEDIAQYTYEAFSDGGVVSYIRYDEDGNAVKDNTIVPNEVTSQNDFPSSYDLRDYNRVTPAKNQGAGGTCWAFSAINCMESNKITQGLSSVSDTDLSEDHLVWFTYKMDPLTGDGITNLSSDNTSKLGAYFGGGFWHYSANSLTNRWGAVNNDRALYDPVNLNNNGNLSESMRTQRDTVLDMVAVIAAESGDSLNNMDYVKANIINNGALDANIYYDSSNLNGCAYYQNEQQGVNHAVSIVGWDDNYSKSNFKSATGAAPSKNGAWLIKNSHGTKHADNGFFWLSYYDMSLKNIAVYIVGDDDCDNVYSYNGFTYLSFYYFPKSSSIKYANTFTANDKEELKSVCFLVAQDDVNVDIKIYKGLSSSSTNPESGTLFTQDSGDIKFRGFYTVDLDTPMPLVKGERYSVVISVTAKSGNRVDIPFEGPAKTINTNSDNGEKYFADYTASPGESYIYHGSQWKDTANPVSTLSDIDFNNAYIKAYTDDAEPDYTSEFTYTVSGSNATITGYNGTRTQINVPGIIDGYTVTAIADRAFRRGSFKSVTLPSTLQTIGEYAFMRCSSLTSITIPKSVTEIKKQAFSDCTALSNVVFEARSSELKLGNFVFLNCNALKKVTVASGYISIGTRALGFTYDYDTETYGTTGLTICGYLNTAAYEYYLANSDYIGWVTLDSIPVSMKIAKTPDKTVYNYKSNSVNLAGIELLVTYSDGTTETVTDTSKMTASGFNGNRRGTQTITVEYEGMQATFDVNVKYTWWQWILVIVLFGWIWY